MTKYEQIEYFRSRVGHLFILKSDKTQLCILRGGFAMNFSLALTFETIGWYRHSCCRSDFSLFGQVPDDEMYENKFFYAFPHQVIDVTND